MHPEDTLFWRIKNGILTISGNSRISIEGGCLRISDGPQGNPVEIRFPRAGCPISRIIITHPTGFVSFAALKWLHKVGVGLTQIDWNGEVILATTFRKLDLASMRRAQCLAAGSELGRDIIRDLLRAKIDGQATVVRLMGKPETAQTLAAMAGQVNVAHTEQDLLSIEAQAALAYWSVWAAVPMPFARRPPAPEDWKFFGTRMSPLTNSPQRAVRPGNAVLNYLYGVLATQVTIALIRVGLDPGIGIFHTDQPRRPSLTYDALEAIRPIIDLWLFFWVRSEGCFAKRDFEEADDGGIRITRPLNSHLAMTAALWRAPADNIAAWLAARLRGERPQLRVHNEMFARGHPLEYEAKRHALRWRVGGIISAPLPKVCVECGRSLTSRRRKFCFAECTLSFHGDSPPRIIALAAARAAGADPSQSESANRRRAERAVHQAAAVREWQSREGWSKQSDRELRGWYLASVQPALARCRLSDIARGMGWSRGYAWSVRRGRFVPHPRHYERLAELAGVVMMRNSL